MATAALIFHPSVCLTPTVGGYGAGGRGVGPGGPVKGGVGTGGFGIGGLPTGMRTYRKNHLTYIDMI